MVNPWRRHHPKCLFGPLDSRCTRYENLVAQIKGNGYKCSNTPLEIGTRGVVNSRNRAVLTELCHWMKVAKVSQVTKTCSKLALLGSYTIWNARHSLDWSSGGYLIPWRANHHHFPHSDTHLIQWISICNHDIAQVMLCHCVGGSTLNTMWSQIIPLVDTLVYDLQFIGSLSHFHQ